MCVRLHLNVGGVIIPCDESGIEKSSYFFTAGNGIGGGYNFSRSFHVYSTARSGLRRLHRLGNDMVVVFADGGHERFPKSGAVFVFSGEVVEKSQHLVKGLRRFGLSAVCIEHADHERRRVDHFRDFRLDSFKKSRSCRYML